MVAFINDIPLDLGKFGGYIEDTVTGTADDGSISFTMEHKQVNGKDRFNCFLDKDWVGWQEELHLLTIELQPKQYANGEFKFGFEARGNEGYVRLT